MWDPVVIFVGLCIEGSMGIEVKRALPSYDAMTSPDSSLAFCMCCTKCCVFLRWCGDWPTKGWMIPASSFATQ